MKEKKAVLFVSFVSVAVLGVFLFAAPNPAPAQAPKPIELNFAEQDPAVGWGPVHAWQPMVKMMEKATNNRIKINYYPGQTLFTDRQLYKEAMPCAIVHTFNRSV